MLAAMRADWRSAGLPTGIWALTRAVSRPSRATRMAAAVNSDCEKKKLVSMLKKHRKKTTKASRLARNSKVLSASNTMIRVTPGSRPRKVPKLKKVAPRAAISSSSSHQRLGSGRALNASQVRQHRTLPVNRLHHRGTWLI